MPAIWSKPLNWVRVFRARYFKDQQIPSSDVNKSERKRYSNMQTRKNRVSLIDIQGVKEIFTEARIAIKN